MKQTNGRRKWLSGGKQQRSTGEGRIESEERVRGKGQGGQLQKQSGGVGGRTAEKSGLMVDM